MLPGVVGISTDRHQNATARFPLTFVSDVVSWLKAPNGSYLTRK